MDYFGINSAEDLPKIREILADQLVEPTVIKDTLPEAEIPKVEGESEAEGDILMSVSEEGELVEKNEESE